jgi:hypothetical protein
MRLIFSATIHNHRYPRPAHTQMPGKRRPGWEHSAVQFFLIGNGKLSVIKLLLRRSGGWSTHEIGLHQTVNFQAAEVQIVGQSGWIDDNMLGAFGIVCENDRDLQGKWVRLPVSIAELLSP